MVSRCSLILAMYAQPYSADCGATEHEEILATLVDGNAERAADLMGSHLDHVAGRALLKPPPETDVRSLLAPCAARLRATEGR